MLLYVLFYFLTSFIQASDFEKTTLYTDRDEGLILANASNFEKILFNKDKITIIEFYNSFCGHCIRFAPVWKKFAYKLRNWNKVVNVVAIDCVDTANIEICLRYKIMSYPNLRLFWANVNSSDILGDEINDLRAKDDFIIDKLLEYILKNLKEKNVPLSWPILKTIQINNKKDLENKILKKHRFNFFPVFGILEKNNKYIGQKVILELSYFSDQLAIYNLNFSITEDFKSFETSLSNDLVLLKLSHEKLIEKVVTIPDTIDNKVDFIIDYINQNYFDGKLDFNLKKKTIKNYETSLRLFKKIVSSKDSALYRSDLYGAIKFTIFHQFTLKETFKGNQLNILIRFFDILNKYFPFDNENFRDYIENFLSWLEQKNQNLNLIDAKEYKEYINNSNFNFSSVFTNWKSCKGSLSNYRGYPCSLWILFHTLTVQEYKQEMESKKWINLHEVIFLMRDFIGEFFTCTECSKNFVNLTSNLENELKHPNSSVIWLWKAHNSVNKCLKGDITEDPEYPKIQYPSKNYCSSCFKENEFDENEVLKYLLNKYNYFNKDVSQEQPLSVKVSYEPYTGFFESKRFFNHTDLSICFTLYFLITAILISLYFYLRVRRRKAKFSKAKFLDFC